MKFYYLKFSILSAVIISALSFSFRPIERLDLQPKDVITWSPDVKLTWNDFKADPEMGNPHAAISNLGIRAPMKGPPAEARIDAYFDPQKSWVKPEKDVPHLLAHEQGHFDITEIYARKLRKEMGEFKFTQKNLSAQYERLFTKVTDELSLEQKRYDQETNWSQNKEKQAEWLEMIAIRLLESEDYSSTLVPLDLR